MVSEESMIIDSISDEISLYIESTQKIIDAMEHHNNLRNNYYFESKNDATREPFLKKIKSVIDKIISKLRSMINSIFRKNTPVLSKYDKVQAIGKDLNKTCIQGIPLGNVKIKIPNVLEYDKHLITVITKSIAEVSMKSYKTYSKKIKGQSKIDILIESVNGITSSLNSYSVTDNNIKEELKKLGKVESKMSMGQRSNSKIRNNIYSNTFGNSSATDIINQQNTVRMNQNNIDRAISNHQSMVYSQQNSMYNAMNTHSMNVAAHYNTMMASVEDNYVDGDITTEGMTSTLVKMMPLPMKALFVVNFAAIAIAAGVSAYNLIKELPSVIKNEKITVSELYSRIQTINPQECEKSLNNLVNQINTSINRERTINEFAAAESVMLQYVNSLQRLIASYTKFKYAELDYYCRLLIETHSKLAIEDNFKKKK